jgi:hypothetical protein
LKRKIVGIIVYTLLIPIFTSAASGVPILSADKENSSRAVFDDDYQLFHPNAALDFFDDLIVECIQQLNETMYLGYLENITAFGPRVTGTSACHQAGDYIYNEFQSMGLEVRYHHWNYQGYQDRNIEGTLPGVNETSDKIYIICAHYDTVANCPGADDDGSGVATVLTAAYILRQYDFNHTIRFVTFSGEEQWMLGSHEYAREAYENGDNIVAVLNVDMIGFAITTYHGNNIKVYHNAASMWLTDFTDDVSEQYYDYINLNVIPSGFAYSDQYYFWEYGYDGLFYHEYEFNDYYHTPQDTIENMNITYATKCSKLVLATLVELAQIANYPPEAPSIDGPTSGAVGIEYEYSFYTTDPNEDDVYYYIEWGDGQVEEWIGSYNSGEIATVNHTWTSPDDYEIRAKAKDTNDAESEWSDVYPVTIVENEPPNAPAIEGETSGKPGNSYPYTFTSTDPDGNQVSYYIKWDDGSITDWTAFQASGPPGYSESHTWDEKGTYTIEAKAKDCDYANKQNISQLVVPQIPGKTRRIFRTIPKCFSNTTNIVATIRTTIKNIVNPKSPFFLFVEMKSE